MDYLYLRRKSNPLRFTAAGDRLIRLANEILPKVVDAERELARVKHGDAGQLRIAVECHTCFDWLMPAMDEFRQHWSFGRIGYCVWFPH